MTNDKREEELKGIIEETILRWSENIVTNCGMLASFLSKTISEKVFLKEELLKFADDNMEYICEQVHKAYCKYKKEKTGEEYWTKGDYSLLKDEGKEYDRRTVRAVIQAITEQI